MDKWGFLENLSERMRQEILELPYGGLEWAELINPLVLLDWDKNGVSVYDEYRQATLFTHNRLYGFKPAGVCPVSVNMEGFENDYTSF